MNGQEIQTKTGRHVPVEQVELTLSKCQQGKSLCISVYYDAPDISLAFLLYRMCKSYEDIIQLLDGRVDSESPLDLRILQWQPDKRRADVPYTFSREKLGELLFFQQELLYQLRISISLLEDREKAYELSGSVATFQILHDYLAQFHSHYA